MSSEQDDFKQLRQLLALKRHEQPPPGYFDDLPREVMAGIRATQAARYSRKASELSVQAPWLARLWEALETKPLLAGVFGTVVCSLLLAGLVLSERAEPTAVATVESVPQPLVKADVQPPSPIFRKVDTQASSTEGMSTLQIRSGTDTLLPALQPASPLFQTLEYKPGQN
jgi:hypothetical protein